MNGEWLPDSLSRRARHIRRDLSNRGYRLTSIAKTLDTISGDCLGKPAGLLATFLELVEVCSHPASLRSGERSLAPRALCALATRSHRMFEAAI
jgi:hypothetical protein